MSICLKDNCSCSHHRILECLEKELNDKAKLALQKLGNLREMVDSSGLTLLHYSAKYGNADMTHYLIGKGCAVNAKDKSGVTPLMLAVAACRGKATKVLLENNADIHATDSDRRNVLQRGFHAIDDEAQPILEMLFEKVGDELLTEGLAQLLSNANDLAKLALAVFGDMEITKFICKTYPSIVNHYEPMGGTALHIAIIFRRLDKVKILIEHGANVDALGEGGRTPLNCYAATAAEDVDENSEVLKILLKHSTSYSTPSQCDGFTDVECLLGLGNKKTVRTLLLSGVNVDACFVKYNCVISSLLNNKNKDVIDLLGEIHVPFDVDARYMSQEHKLVFIASKFKRPEILEFLLRHGADVNVRTSERESALLHVLIETCDGKNNTELEKIIDLLLQYGIKIDFLFLEGDDFMKHLWAVMVNKFASISSARTVIAHVAMVTTMGHLFLDVCYSRIESVPQMKAYFDSCTKQLEEMKNFEVHGPVTLYNVLCEKEEKFLTHARNQEFALEIISVMKNLPQLEPYYLRTLQRNVSTTLDVAKRHGKAPQVIEVLTGLSYTAYHHIVYKIISYLSRQDVHNLCETDNIL